jgi:hypothetical protein
VVDAVGGHFTSNPDVENVGGDNVVAGTGSDRQMWVYDPAARWAGWLGPDRGAVPLIGSTAPC